MKLQRQRMNIKPTSSSLREGDESLQSGVDALELSLPYTLVAPVTLQISQFWCSALAKLSHSYSKKHSSQSVKYDLIIYTMHIRGSGTIM